MSEAAEQPAGAYPATHWTLIYQARDLDQTAGRNALGDLLACYRGALLRHLTWKFQATREQAEDWLHGFVERKILEYQLMRHADQARGRFRTFLLSALDRFVWDEMDKARAQKRRPEQGFVPIEEGFDTPADTAAGAAPHDPGDVEWARGVVLRAVRQTQRWYEAQDSLKTWEAFYLARIQPMLEGAERPSDQHIGERCGLPAAQVSNTINNGARKFRTELRAIIREYTAAEAEADEELRALVEILRRAV